jgi:hypothetical protein
MPGQAGHDVSGKRRADGDFGDPSLDVLHPTASRAPLLTRMSPHWRLELAERSKAAPWKARFANWGPV